MAKGKRKRPDAFRSRIVGEGEEAPDQLLANPLNWRGHPKEQTDALEGLLSEVGWVQRVIVNRRTGHVVDGHARVSLALRRGEASLPVLYVDLSEDEERLVLAALDPIGGLATTDAAKLAELLESVETTDEALRSLLDDLAADAGIAAGAGGADDDGLGEYSQKIEPPTYTPKGERPPIEELVDCSKADDLIRRIDDAPDLKPAEREFLRLAAGRHRVFHYAKVAEFYCHASPQVQKLMEDSGLVIIDFADAIENGYIELSKKLASIYGEAPGEDEPDDDAD